MSCNLTMMPLLLVTKVLKEPTKLSDKNIFGILCTQIFKPMLNHVLNVKEAKWISMQGNLLYIPFLLKRLPLIEYTWTSLVLSKRPRKAISIFILSLILSANFQKHFYSGSYRSGKDSLQWDYLLVWCSQKHSYW